MNYQGQGEMFQMFRLSGRLDILLFLFFGGIIFAAGCGSSGPAAAPISVTITPSEAALGAGQTIPFAAATSDGSSVTWSASAGTIDATGNYTAPSGAQSVTVTVTATSKKDKTKSANATVNVVAPGQVAATANVQVATYTISPAAVGNVSVQFGTDTSYGLTTWAEPVPNGGGAVSLFVAGMKGNTLYHMRAVVQFSDGSQYTDADQTFTTRRISRSRHTGVRCRDESRYDATKRSGASGPRGRGRNGCSGSCNGFSRECSVEL